MSTTDRAAFEQYAQSQGCNDFEYDQDDGQRYRNPFTQREYKYWRAALEWQAGTEAAKATGTAGELPELPEPTASSPHGVHLYSLEKMLSYARAAIHKQWCSEVNCDAVREELAELKAARQPEAIKATGTAPEQCPDPEACNAQGCCNPRGRCEEAHTTGTAGELSESQKIAMQYGQQLNDAEATAFVSGIELGKELEARQPAQVVVMDESWLVQQILLFRGNGRPIDKESAERCARTIMAKFAATNRSQPEKFTAQAGEDIRHGQRCVLNHEGKLIEDRSQP